MTTSTAISNRDEDDVLAYNRAMHYFCELFFHAVKRWMTYDNEEILKNRIHLMEVIAKLIIVPAADDVSMIELVAENTLEELLSEAFPTAGKDYRDGCGKMAFRAASQVLKGKSFQLAGRFFDLTMLNALRTLSLPEPLHSHQRAAIAALRLLFRLPESAGVARFMYTPGGAPYNMPPLPEAATEQELAAGHPYNAANLTKALLQMSRRTRAAAPTPTSTPPPTLSLLCTAPQEEATLAHRFKELPVDEERKVIGVVNGPSNLDVLVEKFNTPMNRAKMVCLKSATWLNDEVINFYMCMLKERDELMCAKQPGRRHPSHFFNSFFMDNLLIKDHVYTYVNVHRWTKTFNAFEMDKIFFPVNLSNTHWALVVVYMQRKEVHYYDSLNGSGKKWVKGILRWVRDEAEDMGIANYGTANWTCFDQEPHVPKQTNGCDCGVFACICADFLSDDLPLRYSQDDMPFFRNKICADILRGSLSYPV